MNPSVSLACVDPLRESDSRPHPQPPYQSQTGPIGICSQVAQVQIFVCTHCTAEGLGSRFICSGESEERCHVAGPHVPRAEGRQQAGDACLCPDDPGSDSQGVVY